jgi:hypothetical protein
VEALPTRGCLARMMLRDRYVLLLQLGPGKLNSFSICSKPPNRRIAKGRSLDPLSPMPRPILIVSRDEVQRRIYSHALKQAGFSTVQADATGISLTMMRFDCIATTVFDSSFTPEEQHGLIERLERLLSPIHLVYMDRRSADTKELERACAHCARQRGPGRFYSIDGTILTVSSRAERLARASGCHQDR